MLPKTMDCCFRGKPHIENKNLHIHKTPSNDIKPTQTRKQTHKKLDQETGKAIELLTTKSHPHNNQHAIAQIGQIGTNPPPKRDQGN